MAPAIALLTQPVAHLWDQLPAPPLNAYQYQRFFGTEIRGPKCIIVASIGSAMWMKGWHTHQNLLKFENQNCVHVSNIF
jgi:hypothetical protein